MVAISLRPYEEHGFSHPVIIIIIIIIIITITIITIIVDYAASSRDPS